MPAAAALAPLLVLAQAAVAPAQAWPGVRLESSIVECPSPSELESAIRQVLREQDRGFRGWALSYRRDPASTDDPADVSIHMELVDPGGQRMSDRHISANRRDCPVIASAMAAVVERSLRTVGWTREVPLPPPAVEQAPDRGSGKQASREQRPRVVLGAGPAVAAWSAGAPPGPTMNLLVDARIRAKGPFSLRLAGGVFSGNDSQGVGSAGSARVTSRYLIAAPLAVFVLRKVELAGGPGVLFGIDSASSAGVTQGSSGSRQRLAVGVGIAAAFWLSPRWRLSAGLEGFRAALGADYVIDISGQRTVVLSPSKWMGIASARVEFVAWP
jgi:hypothetical protein